MCLGNLGTPFVARNLQIMLKLIMRDHFLVRRQKVWLE